MRNAAGAEHPSSLFSSRVQRARESPKVPFSHISRRRDLNMARRFLAAALVIALAPVDLAFAQTGAAAAAPGTIRESIDREGAKQMLAGVVPVPRRSAALGESSETTL